MKIKTKIQWWPPSLSCDCLWRRVFLFVCFEEVIKVKWGQLKLKKVGKTTRPFRYDLNQIPYDYTVEVRNRFKGLDLIECLMNYEMRFMTLYRRQGSRPSPWKRNAKKQNGCLRSPYKKLWKEEKWKAKEKRKDIPIWIVPKNSKKR